MESLPTIPVPIIVALLAGVFFLRHAWSHSFSEKQYQRTKLPEETQTASGESESVSKESDFPADWYTGKNVYEVERRAIFSKV